MTKNKLNFILVIYHSVMVLSPFVLICFHIYHLFTQGEISAIPLTHIFYDYMGIDLLFEGVSERMEFYNKVYSAIVKMPLLLLLFILAIPSFRRVYKYIEE